MSSLVERFLAVAEELRQHPILASLRNGVMWSLVPAGMAMLPLYFVISADRDFNLRLMDVYLASLGVMGPACALFIAQFISKSYKIRSGAGPVALIVYLSLLKPWPTNGKALVDILRNTFTSG